VHDRSAQNLRCLRQLASKRRTDLRQAIILLVDTTRLDRWLWAVRLSKTRPDAAAVCRGGHVRVNGKPAKPATPVHPGDEIRARVNDITRIVEVVRVIQSRVGAVDAATCFVDHTPPPPDETLIAVARRERGAGRPTKRERRVLEEFRTRSS